MGFTVLMFGMSVMSNAVSDLGRQPWFTETLATLSNPILGILAGALFTGILQSASAAVGIVQALSVTGAMTFESSLPLLMGIAIGAAFPVLLSALGANTDGKRTAAVYLVAATISVIICAALFYFVGAFIQFPFLKTGMNPFSMAFVNTVLRLAIVVLLLPFTDALEKLVRLIVREKPQAADQVAVRLEERFLAHPALAVEQSRLTIVDMAERAREALSAALALTANYSREGFAEVEKMESDCDRYEDALGSYLVKLTALELTRRQNEDVSKYLHTLTDFERISDHALNIAQSAQEIHEKKIDFSDHATRELSVLSAAVREIVRLATQAFEKNDLALASRVEPLEELIDQLCDEAKRRHIERLQQAAAPSARASCSTICSPASSASATTAPTWPWPCWNLKKMLLTPTPGCAASRKPNPCPSRSPTRITPPGLPCDAVIIPLSVDGQLYVGGHCFLQAEAHVGHIAEIHESRGGILFHARFDLPFDQAFPQKRFVRADGNGIVRAGFQIAPAIPIQQQIIALQQHDIAVHPQGVFHRIVKQSVVHRPAAGLPRRHPFHALRKGLQIEGNGRALDGNHGDQLPAPFRLMGYKVFLPPVKAVHADGLDAAQALLPCQLFQKAQQGAFPRPGRGGQHHQHPAALLPPQVLQRFQKRQKNFFHRLPAVSRQHVDPIDIYRICDHTQASILRAFSLPHYIKTRGKWQANRYHSPYGFMVTRGWVLHTPACSPLGFSSRTFGAPGRKNRKECFPDGKPRPRGKAPRYDHSRGRSPDSPLRGVYSLIVSNNVDDIIPFRRFVFLCKKTVDNVPACVIICPLRREWCNGNTWVSKTFVEGSNPSSPAKAKILSMHVGRISLCILHFKSSGFILHFPGRIF